MATSTPMIPITTNNSTSEKPTRPPIEWNRASCMFRRPLGFTRAWTWSIQQDLN
jgi:hypothetical protein